MDVNLVNNELGLDVLSGSDIDALHKALTAGDSANPDNMGTGGNTLQYESLEAQLINALNEQVDDFKIMKIQAQKNVGSTVHQYTQVTDSGSIQGVGTAELGDPIQSESEFARNTRNVKYFQTQREAALQTNELNPIVGGLKGEAVEERMGTHVLLKATEQYCFEGNENVTPFLPSGYPQQIREEAPQNVFDFNGIKVSDPGAEDIMTDAFRNIYEQGGETSDMFFPPTLALDWMNLIKDGMRYNHADRVAGTQLTTYQQMYGKDILISGRAGIDKMYKIKNRPSVSTVVGYTPSLPTFVAVAQAETVVGTGFISADAGTYRYTVFSIQANGLISAAAVAANVVVVAGEEVKLTITPAADVPKAQASGYIICRGRKDVTTGDDQREMYRVADSGVATTITLDLNDELPGTAEMLLLSSDGIESSYQWDAFMPLRRFNLGATRASIPFLMIWYGTPDLKIAKHNGIIKNVGHQGVNSWFG